jgi:hypothetical protein
MSLMDKIKSFFSGGSSNPDTQAGQEYTPSPTAPTVPADPVGMPTSEPGEMPESDEDRSA